MLDMLLDPRRGVSFDLPGAHGLARRSCMLRKQAISSETCSDTRYIAECCCRKLHVLGEKMFQL